MPNRDEFFAQKNKTSLLLCANFGEGKTTVGISFPKFYYIGFRQGGLSVLEQDKNAKFRDNLVHYEELVPMSDEELREFFSPANRAGKLFKVIDHAKELAKKGEVDTLFIDDFTDCVNNIQKFVWTFKKSLTEKGAEDTQKMYGTLLRDLSDLFDRDIMTFRKVGNLVVACHLMRESEQTVEGVKTRAGLVDKMSNIFPDISGSFRREIQRKFENVFYLENRLQDKKFVAYTCKQLAFGTVILAKNVKGLPPIVENASYQTLFPESKAVTSKASS